VFILIDFFAMNEPQGYFVTTACESILISSAVVRCALSLITNHTKSNEKDKTGVHNSGFC